MTEDELLDDVKHWKGRADAANSMVDLLEKNARVQAKLLADTGRQRDALVKALGRSRAQHHEDGMWETHPLLIEIDRVLADVGGSGT